MNKFIGAIPKSDVAEVRVSTTKFKDRPVLDIRVWFIPRDAVDFVPSRKGVTVDLSKVHDLINLLERIGK
jgi:hypothetical protein